MTYREFISDNNLQLVDKLKAETDLETIKKTEKPLPEFDSQKEQELLSVLKNSIGNSLNEHFAYIELQNYVRNIVKRILSFYRRWTRII